MLVVFHQSLSDNTSPQVSRTLLSILGNLNNAEIWMVSILPLIFNSFSLFSEYLVTILSAPTITSITITLMFTVFLILRQDPNICLSFHFLYFHFVVCWNIIIIIIIISFLVSSSEQLQLMVSLKNLSDSKSPQVSRTICSILANFHNAVVWMVLILLLISNSSNPFFKPLGTIPSIPTTTSNTVTLMFHSFFSSLARSKYLFLFSLSLIFILWSVGTAKSTRLQVLFFLLINTRCVIFRLELGDLCVCQNPREFNTSHSLEQILVCTYII